MCLCGSAAPNCGPYREGKDFRPYEAEPDIAGIGANAQSLWSQEADSDFT